MGVHYPAWLDRLESFNFFEMPPAVWSALEDKQFNEGFHVERFLDAVAENGFRRDMEWLVANGVITDETMSVYRTSKAVNYL